MPCGVQIFCFISMPPKQHATLFSFKPDFSVITK